MKSKVLLVDDDENVLHAYRRNLRLHFDIFTATGGKEGIELLKSEGPFEVVVADYYMPEMNGLEFINLVRQFSPNTVRVILSGQADLQATIEAINEGSIFRFLYKPCSTENLISTIQASVEQYQLIVSEKELLNNTLKGSIHVLVDILSIINPQVFSLAVRLPKTMRSIANRLDYKNIWEIELAGLLSPIGSVTVPKEILEKLVAGNELEPEELKVWFAHPGIGRNILAKIPRLENIAEGIYYQFKDFDGGGYPENDRRYGVRIPLIGRLVRVANDYETLLSRKIPEKIALEIMRQRSGKYDPGILAALEAEVLSLEKGYIVKYYGVNELLPGMILADDVKDTREVTLIPSDYEITDILKARLQNFAEFGQLSGMVKVKVPIVSRGQNIYGR